jgi:pSer/pThr/pTyr-binding forkhead associated (FHA) protein
MHRLVVNPGTPQAWEIILKPGFNSIGRGQENDFTISHDSVSTLHCQIIVDGDTIKIEDLGSTNGTFINDQPTREARLLPGQRIRLGEIGLLLESEGAALEPARLEQQAAPVSLSGRAVDEPGQVVWARWPSVATSTVEEEKAVYCKNHYQNLAKHKCEKCKRYLCDLCINTRGSSAGGLKFCKICGHECLPVRFKPSVEQVNFFAAVPQAFIYPFIGDGLMLLFGGTFFFGFLDLANYISRHAFKYGLRAMMMRVTIFTFIFGTGYLFAYLKKIIAATADGDPHMPDWPEFSEWQADIVAPMFQFVVISLLSFGPALIFQIWGEWADWDNPWLFVVPASLLGCVYFPMAFLGVAIFDTLAAALKPAFVVGSIVRVPREYSLAAAVFIGIIGIRWVSGLVLGVLMKIPLVPALVADLLMIYLLMIEARILGLLFLSKRRTLGWFKKDRPATEN